MKRGTVTVIVTLVLSVLFGPFTADAQRPGKAFRVGWLGLPRQAANADFIGGFLEGLRQLGYTEGSAITLEYRFADGRAERLSGLALELVNLDVDAIVVVGSQAAAVAKQATMAIPIVMVSVGDPVGAGLVTSLAKPGGNITGVSAGHGEISEKWLELLREVVPRASRFAYLGDPNAPMSPIFLRRILGAARTLGVSVEFFPVTEPDDVEPQLAAMTRARVKGIIVDATPMPRTRQKEIVAFAAANRLPVMYAGRDYVDAGGLMSYDASRPDMGRRGAYYIDRILKGMKPADLPVEEPTKFEFVINLKTASALGLTIPSLLLQRADHVIH